MSRFRVISRLLALLLIAEGAAGVAYGLWLTASLAGMAEMAGWFEVDAPAWAAVVGAQIAATVVLPGAALVIGGRRWWLRSEAFDGSRRRWIYAVLIVHLLVLVFGAVSQSVLAVTAGGIGVGSALGALVAGITGHIDESETPTAPWRWRRLAGGAAATVALVTSAAAVGAAITTDDSEGPFVLGTYPEDSVICRGDVTEACAQRVAARAGRPVAWTPSDGDREGRAFIVLARDIPPPLGEGRVLQELDDGWVHLSVYTHPAPPTFGGRRFVRQVTVGDATADLFVDDDDTSSADLEWTREGVAYRISALRVSDDEESVVESARRALAQVRYTNP